MAFCESCCYGYRAHLGQQVRFPPSTILRPRKIMRMEEKGERERSQTE